MKKHIIRYASFALAILGMVSCSEEVETTSRYKDAQSTPMTFAVNYPGQSRATATSFESNDKIGLYVAESKAPLEIGGNLVNNEALTYDGSKWEAARTLYWDEGTYNAYAYYPYIQGISSTTDHCFSHVVPLAFLLLPVQPSVPVLSEAGQPDFESSDSYPLPVP